MVRKEASKLCSSLEAEKAAKDAVHEKLDSVQTTLSETDMALKNQRDLAQKIGETAAQV